MNGWTTGLKVQFSSFRIATNHGRVGKLTRSSFSRCASGVAL